MKTKRVVIKIGSSSITNHEVGLNVAAINNLAAQISQIRKDGFEVAVVSSGAVAAGRFRLGDGIGNLVAKQIAAAYGQNMVTLAWDDALAAHNILVAQFLLTGNDLEYPKDTLLGALKRGIAVINANDTVNAEEMKQYIIAADNDNLSVFVAGEINAEILILLTDVEGVLNQSGEVISHLNNQSQIDQIVTIGKSKVGTGGMQSKLSVAWKAATQGRHVWIANANEENVLLKIMQNKKVGTRIYKDEAAKAC